MAVGDQVLKSWLRQKYTDNNTLKTRFNSGTSLTVPDTSNSSTLATDINTLVTSLRAMQTNTYLRYSPLWSSVNINNVSASDIIANTKKDSIDNLITDLLAMCVNYSKTPTEYAKNDSNATAFTFNSSNATAFTNNTANVTTFTQNSTNVSSFEQFSNLQFTFNSSNLVGNTQNSTNATAFFRDNTNATAFARQSNANGFTQNTSRVATFSFNTSNCSQTCSRFTQNSSNRSGLRFTKNASNRVDFTNFTRNSQASSFSKNTQVSFTRNDSNNPSFTQDSTYAAAFGQFRTFFSNNTDKTATVNRFFRYDTNAAAFTQNSTNATAFSRDSRVSTFTQNSTNASTFSRDTRFSQRFVYSFIVKSDRSTTTHSNIGT